MSYGKAIKAINPNAEFTIDNNDLDNIVWLNGTTPIAKEDIISKADEISYIAKRQKEYPSIAGQLDDI